MKSLHLCFTSLLLQDVLTGLRLEGPIIQAPQPYAMQHIKFSSDPQVIVFKYQLLIGVCQYSASQRYGLMSHPKYRSQTSYQLNQRNIFNCDSNVRHVPLMDTKKAREVETVCMWMVLTWEGLTSKEKFTMPHCRGTVNVKYFKYVNIYICYFHVQPQSTQIYF